MATRSVLQQHMGVAINLQTSSCTALAGWPSPSSSSPGSSYSTTGLHKAQCLGVSNSMKTSVFGDVKQLSSSIMVPSAPIRGRKPVITMVKPTLQFIKGVDELSVPEVKMTVSRDGDNGTATFIFDQPSVFESSLELGDITGLYMIDEEGTMSTVEVSAKFLNGKPSKIEARYIMRNRKEWDRFLRFMERYSEANNLGFVKK